MIHPHLQAENAKNGGLIAGVPPMRKFVKKPKSSSTKKDLSTTKVALYLLRFNVALQIAAFAIVINLCLAIATFWYGLNSLYCAFGMDCIIGVITSSILVWRFASSKTDHLKNQQHVYLLNSYTDSPYVTNRQNIIAVNKYDLLDSTSLENPNEPEDHVRELWSSFWLGQVMIIAGIGVVIRTVVEIVTHVMVFGADGEEYSLDRFDYGADGTLVLAKVEITSMEPLYWLAFLSLCLNLLLMIAKMVVYIFLNSNSMLIEGVNSFISALFGLVSMVSIRYSESFQSLDQIVSILFGIFLIIYGGYQVLTTVGKTVYQIVKKNQRSGYDMLV